MRTMTATEASRGFSDLLDSVENGETVTVTRGGEAIAEVRPARRKAGRDLRRVFESRPSLLADDDQLMSDIDATHELLVDSERDLWGDD